MTAKVELARSYTLSFRTVTTAVLIALDSCWKTRTNESWRSWRN